MEEKNFSLHTALDDLRVIRQVLDRTAASFRTLAPVFRRMGLVWLCQAVLYTLAVTTDLLIYLSPTLYNYLSWTRALIPAAQWSMLPLGIYLAVECILWQRKKTTYAPLSGQLVTLWQFFLLLYLVLFALFRAGMYWQTHDLPMVLPELSEEVVNLWTGFLICQGFLAFLPVLFPGVPLLITGAMLGEKVLGWLGAAVCALTAFAILAPMVTGFPTMASMPLPLFALDVVIVSAAPFFPPAALLLTARRLGRRQEGA